MTEIVLCFRIARNREQRGGMRLWARGVVQRRRLQPAPAGQHVGHHQGYAGVPAAAQEKARQSRRYRCLRRR